jgi:saccharopine dehydrogenase-like NADP-dependent oxidoreductase
MKILLLGVGLQGRAALYDLAHSPDVAHVIAADADISTLRAFSESLPTDRVSATRVDVRDEARVAELMQKAQAVIALLPHTFRAPIARQAVECGIHYVDASYPDGAYDALASKAAAAGVAILPEMGLDPGIDLLLARQAVSELDVVTRLDSYGGGIPTPEAADNPLRYKIS